MAGLLAGTIIKGRVLGLLVKKGVSVDTFADGVKSMEDEKRITQAKTE